MIFPAGVFGYNARSMRATVTFLAAFAMLSLAFSQDSPVLGSGKKFVVVAPGRVRVSEEMERRQLVPAVSPAPVCPRSVDESPDVKLAVVISKEGKVSEIKVVSGAPKMSEAVVRAVKTWKFYTFFLSGQPQEVETTLHVHMNCP